MSIVRRRRRKGGKEEKEKSRKKNKMSNNKMDTSRNTLAVAGVDHVESKTGVSIGKRFQDLL